jgi:hypothetical protein
MRRLATLALFLFLAFLLPSQAQTIPATGTVEVFSPDGGSQAAIIRLPHTASPIGQ